MIFPFKTTNQTQILDLWFSLSKSQTQTHIETNWTQKIKKKKMEIEVERGREAMGEEDEMGRRLCNSEIGDGEDKRSWESREL